MAVNVDKARADRHHRARAVSPAQPEHPLGQESLDQAGLLREFAETVVVDRALPVACPVAPCAVADAGHMVAVPQRQFLARGCRLSNTWVLPQSGLPCTGALGLIERRVPFGRELDS